MSTRSCLCTHPPRKNSLVGRGVFLFLAPVYTHLMVGVVPHGFLASHSHLGSCSQLNRCLREINECCVFIRERRRDQQRLRAVSRGFCHPGGAPLRWGFLA